MDIYTSELPPPVIVSFDDLSCGDTFLTTQVKGLCIKIQSYDTTESNKPHYNAVRLINGWFFYIAPTRKVEVVTGVFVPNLQSIEKHY